MITVLASKPRIEKRVEPYDLIPIADHPKRNRENYLFKNDRSNESIPGRGGPISSFSIASSLIFPPSSYAMKNCVKSDRVT